MLQPGVVNLDITLAVERQGYFYAPDPSSQRACTIGGNVAENSGGPHTLAYGVTTNHVLGLEVRAARRHAYITTGGKEPDSPGYDLTGLLTGSEGTMALVTKIIVRLMRQPEKVKTMLAVYDSADDAPTRWPRSPPAPSRRSRSRCWTATCCAWSKRPRTPAIRWMRRPCC